MLVQREEVESDSVESTRSYRCSDTFYCLHILHLVRVRSILDGSAIEFERSRFSVRLLQLFRVHRRDDPVFVDSVYPKMWRKDIGPTTAQYVRAIDENLWRKLKVIRSVSVWQLEGQLVCNGLYWLHGDGFFVSSWILNIFCVFLEYNNSDWIIK